MSVLLAGHLTALGLTPLEVGVILTGTLFGSAALTLFVGLRGHRVTRRSLLVLATALMGATGLGFAAATGFWPLLLIAVVGTLNPSAGDVSVFLPIEQSIVSDSVAPVERTNLFALYNLSGALAGALGALSAALPPLLTRHFDLDMVSVVRATFVGYALVALLAAVVYSGLSSAIERPPLPPGTAPLARSRKVVVRLAILFSIDSAGGGLVVQSLLVLWLYQRFGLSVETAAQVFFAAGLLSGASQLVSARLAGRFGLIPTMVFTHLPANLFLMLAAFMPTAGWAITFLLLRMALSQMDVPARQAYVMSVVPPEERAAAASVTNVPRSLAAALTPVAAGALLAVSDFGWPLLIAGGMKAAYDLLLLFQFRSVKAES